MLLSNKLVRFNSVSSVLKRFKNTLVIVEHDNAKVNAVTLNAITAATKIPQNETITCIVAGSGDCAAVASQVASVSGVSKVLVASSEAFKGFLPEMLAPVIVQSQQKFAFTHIVVGSSAFGKSLLPRVAAHLDAQPVSDVIGITEPDTFVRTIYAGNAIQTVRAKDAVKLLSVRGTAFEAAKLQSAATPAGVDTLTFTVPSGTRSTFVSQQLSKSDRPALVGARVVVSGGRGLQNGDNFKMLYELADHMNAAVGASRAAVDAGYVPNDMQIGQTGKIVAPELYIGIGVSGAIQHLAGMKVCLSSF